MMKESEVQRFWSDTEARIGERVLVNSLGQYLSGRGDIRPGTWGLFFVSESALHFQTFPSENWFGALLRRSRSAREPEQELEFSVPCAAIEGVRLLKENSWFRRLVAPQPPVVVVEYTREAAGPADDPARISEREAADGTAAHVVDSREQAADPNAAGAAGAPAQLRIKMELKVAEFVRVLEERSRRPEG